MIEALQVIILLPLLSVSMPANTGKFFGHLTQIAAFDLLETNEFFTEELELEPKEPLSINFEATGFENTYFLNNLGSFAIVLAFEIPKLQ